MIAKYERLNLILTQPAKNGDLVEGFKKDKQISKCNLSGLGRKIRKPLMERQRRARINLSLNKIRDVLVELRAVPCDSEGNRSTKLEKADILEHALNFIQSLVSAPAPAALLPGGHAILASPAGNETNESSSNHVVSSTTTTTTNDLSNVISTATAADSTTDKKRCNLRIAPEPPRHAYATPLDNETVRPLIFQQQRLANVDHTTAKRNGSGGQVRSSSLHDAKPPLMLRGGSKRENSKNDAYYWRPW